VDTGYGFVVYEVPQHGGEPHFYACKTLEEAKKTAEELT
jgi:hypothetical protein